MQLEGNQVLATLAEERNKSDIAPLSQLCRKVMRALPKSYGDISTLTLSPTLMRMKFLRILPEMCARTSCPLGSATRNMVPGNTCVTVPSNSIGSSLATLPDLSL